MLYHEHVVVSVEVRMPVHHSPDDYAISIAEAAVREYANAVAGEGYKLVELQNEIEGHQGETKAFNWTSYSYRVKRIFRQLKVVEYKIRGYVNYATLDMSIGVIRAARLVLGRLAPWTRAFLKRAAGRILSILKSILTVIVAVVAIEKSTRRIVKMVREKVEEVVDEAVPGFMGAGLIIIAVLALSVLDGGGEYG